ncbi:MAG: hypothetical protein AB1651_02325 [Pseudomonadota bacterium]|jgi:hypothetical protein
MSTGRSASLYQLCQSGFSLVVALIMLVIMTATTLMIFRISNTGTQIVGNMQFRNEALALADGTLQEAISTTRVFDTPDTLFLDPCDNVNNRRCYDVDGNGDDDVQVDVVPPACVQVNIIPTRALDSLDPFDQDCLTGAATETGTEGVDTGASLCARSIWEARANAQDYGGSGTTGARMSVVQGVGVTIDKGSALAGCPGS